MTITYEKRMELRRKRQARKRTQPKPEYPKGLPRAGWNAQVPGGARMVGWWKPRGTADRARGRWTDPAWVGEKVTGELPGTAAPMLEAVECNSQQHTRAPGTDRPQPTPYGMDLSWNDRVQHLGYESRK